MQQRSRIGLTVASLLLITAYLFPIWRIELEAPQYPEGLGMEIWVNTVQGIKQHDLRNINSLNHYIGMKTIEPDAIPELTYMPWIIGFLMAFGLVAAASGKRSLLYTWTALFIVIAIVGLVDFWLWEYDYGHNLDMEKAIIKIPGMSYQPPLIGRKQLLNFVAASWPALGGIATFLSAGIGVALSWLEFRRNRNQPAPEPAVAPTQVALA